jgi:RNA exonuclease 1
VPGLDAQTWRVHRASLPTLGGRLGEPVPVLAQRADVWHSQSVRALFSVPETKKAKATRGAAPRPPLPPPHPPSHYVLTDDQLRVCEFPLAGIGEDGVAVPPDGYIATQPRAAAGAGERAPPPPPPPRHALISLDCEMCETRHGFEVTRVSLVDGDGAVLVDELVRPDAPIIEYHTRFSGITAAMLEGVTTRLADAQAAVLAHLASDTLLVGHGLENDLRALRISHAAIIDTSVLYPHPRGLPARTALRRLAATFLKKNIQGGQHDSVEDARVALELARLIFKHGPAWGVEAPDKGEKLCLVLSELGRRATLVDRPDVINRHVAGVSGRSASGESGRGKRGMRPSRAKQGRGPALHAPGPPIPHAHPTFLHSRTRSLKRHAGRTNALPCATDGEAVAKAARVAGAPGVSFVWTQLMGLDAFHRSRAEARRSAVEAWAQRVASAGGEGDGEPPGPMPPLHDGGSGGGSAGGGGTDAPAGSADAPPDADDTARLDAVLAGLDGHLASLEAALPPNTLLIVTTCQGDTHDTRRLQQQAYRRAQGLDGLPPWSPGAEAHLDAVRERGMQALAFCTVKK